MVLKEKPLDVNALVGLLPHRYPFLLVDYVNRCVPGDCIEGIKNLSKTEPNVRAGQGFCHLLVIEALAQLSVLLAFTSLHITPQASDLTFFAGIDDASFGVVPRAGDRVHLSSRLVRIRKRIGWFDATASVEDRTVVLVRMIAAIRPS